MKDKELILLLEREPERGIHELMNLYGAAIHTICTNFLYDCPEDDIEETIADTYINFWRNRDKVKMDAGYSLKSYLYAIARNAARDKRRSLKKADIYSIEELELHLVSEENIEKGYEKKEMEAALHHCLENMKEPDKTIFLYRYFYGYKTGEIAVMIGLSTKKVENILYKGKERLRKELIERGICYEG